MFRLYAGIQRGESIPIDGVAVFTKDIQVDHASYPRLAVLAGVERERGFELGHGHGRDLNELPADETQEHGFHRQLGSDSQKVALADGCAAGDGHIRFVRINVVGAHELPGPGVGSQFVGQLHHPGQGGGVHSPRQLYPRAVEPAHVNGQTDENQQHHHGKGQDDDALALLLFQIC